MAAQTSTARDVARLVSKATGRDVNAKRVRQWVRDHIAAFDDDGYTAHQYSAQQVRAIVAGMTKGAKGARSSAASAGRSGKPRAKRTAPVAPSAATESAE